MNPDNERPVSIRITHNVGSGKLYHWVTNPKIINPIIAENSEPIITPPVKPNILKPNRFNHLEVNEFSRHVKI